MRSLVKWADVEAVKAELQTQLDIVLGGITAQDLEEPEKKKKKEKKVADHPSLALLTSSTGKANDLSFLQQVVHMAHCT